MRKTLLCLLSLCLVYFPKAQHKLPSLDFTPQSPTTAAFTRYGDIPVDISTGVPAVNIPIYNLNSHGINVPISLSYHASGIKVQDVAGPAGLGWTLNAGGVITRTVLGQPDELLDLGLTHKPYYKNAADFSTWGQTYALSEGRFEAGWLLYNDYLNKSQYDYYSDRFYYSLGNGESGIFRRDFETDEIKLIPYRPLNVKLFLAEKRIELTASDGTLYIFKGGWDQWNLSKIVNSSKTDSVMFYSHTESLGFIGFNDVSYFGAYKTMTTDRYECELVPTGDPSCPTTMAKKLNGFEERFAAVSSSWSDVVLLDSVVSSDAVVNFSYISDRTDYRILGPNSDVGVPKSRLTRIQVFSRPASVLVKEVNFSQSYFGDQLNHLTKRLRLDNVEIGASKEEKYAFKYHGSWLPPYPTGQNGFYEDFWGYYNGVNSNHTNLSNEFTPSGVSHLFPDEESARSCVLEEIQYPTGGKTVFEFESNRVNRDIYDYGFTSPLVPADGKVGGLRVKKIATYAYEGAIPQVKKYQYEIDGTGYYYKELAVSKFAYVQNVFYDYFISFFGTNCGSYSRSYFTNRNVAYARPFGYTIGTSEAPLVYDKITEFNGDENVNAGKTVYYYNPDLHLMAEHFEDEPRFQGLYWRDRGNYNPELNQKEEYKNENGAYKLIRKTVNRYALIKQGSFSTGFNLASDLEFISFSGPSSDAFARYNNDPRNEGLGEYYYNTMHFSDTKAYTDLSLYAGADVYDYVDGINYVKTSTVFDFNQYGQQIASTATTSKGDAIITKFTYPVDYPAQAPYTTMVDRNNISPVIEQSTYKNTYDPVNFLQSTKTNYNYWNYATQIWGNNTSNQILPQTVETKKGINLPETRIRYFNYDGNGNPLYVAKENDTRQNYLWGYNNTYPIAHVMNVPQAEKPHIRYTSFEDNATNNWFVFGGNTIVEDNTVPTGKKCLLLSFSQLSGNLEPGSAYILSYWYKTGSSVSVSANSAILTSSAPKNGWVFMRRRITGATDLTISGSGFIDEVRLYPESAQMKTIAYEPLVGITAQSDVNDKITYYTYDASGRLTLIKDDDGNVLKKICYNFQGQPDACGVDVTPLWQTTGVTRCKACPQNSNYITNIMQQEERDNNPNSSTYGNTRWTDAGYSSNCIIQPDWQNTANTRCVTTNNQNTGEQERQQTDANPCSSSYGQTRWVSAGTNTAACPLPPAFRSAAINRNYLKQNCGSQQIPVPYPVSLPEGAFISANNAAEANALAEQEAQRQANTSGGCATVYVRLTKENEHTDEYGEVTQANMAFRFYSNPAGTPGTEINLPSDMILSFIIREYDTSDGEIVYEDTGAFHYSMDAGRNNYIMTDAYITNCISNYCMNFEYSLAPGRYVIIP